MCVCLFYFTVVSVGVLTRTYKGSAGVYRGDAQGRASVYVVEHTQANRFFTKQWLLDLGLLKTECSAHKVSARGRSSPNAGFRFPYKGRAVNPGCVFSVIIMAVSLDLDGVSGQWVPAVSTG